MKNTLPSFKFESSTIHSPFSISVSLSVNGALFQILAPKSLPKTFTFPLTNQSQIPKTPPTKILSNPFTSHFFFFFFFFIELLQFPFLDIEKFCLFGTSQSNSISPRWSYCSGNRNQLRRHRRRHRTTLILLPLVLLYLVFVNFVFFFFLMGFVLYFVGFMSTGERQWWNPQPSCVFSGMNVLFLGFGLGSKIAEFWWTIKKKKNLAQIRFARLENEEPSYAANFSLL